MRHKKGVDVQSDDSKQVDTESTFRVFDMGRWKVKPGQYFTILISLNISSGGKDLC